MGRAPCCDKASVKRGPWSPEEDATLLNFIQTSGTGGNWIALPRKAGLKRCGKSCRLRWLNYLRPDIKHGAFTEEEDNIISTLHSCIGSRWSFIASHLPGRTDNGVKNHWNTKLKKKLFPGNITDPRISRNNSENSPDMMAASPASISEVEACCNPENSPFLNANSGTMAPVMAMDNNEHGIVLKETLVSDIMEAPNFEYNTHTASSSSTSSSQEVSSHDSRSWLSEGEINFADFGFDHELLSYLHF